MERPRFTPDRLTFYNVTSISAKLIKRHLEVASNMVNDTHVIDRMLRHECKACFYSRGRLGGSAITHRQCGLCNAVMSFANTCTGSICGACARTHNLCRHCGGDINMNVRRRKWPQRISGEVPGNDSAPDDDETTTTTKGATGS